MIETEFEQLFDNLMPEARDLQIVNNLSAQLRLKIWHEEKLLHLDYTDGAQSKTLTITSLLLVLTMALSVCLLGHAPLWVTIGVVLTGLGIAPILVKRGARQNLWAITNNRVIRVNSDGVSEWTIASIRFIPERNEPGCVSFMMGYVSTSMVVIYYPRYPEKLRQILVEQVNSARTAAGNQTKILLKSKPEPRWQREMAIAAVAGGIVACSYNGLVEKPKFEKLHPGKTDFEIMERLGYKHIMLNFSYGAGAATGLAWGVIYMLFRRKGDSPDQLD